MQAKLPVKVNLNYFMIQMSKYYVKKLSCPNKHNSLSRPVPTFVHILTSVMFPRRVLVENQSPVTIRHLSYSGLNRQLDLLYHFVSQFPPRKVMRSLVGVHFSAGAAEVVDAPLKCAL